jgi:hypothetical protein
MAHNQEVHLDTSLDPREIPDLEKLTATIKEFLLYLETEEIRALEQDKDTYIETLRNKFPEFSVNFYGIFNMLSDRTNLDANIKKLMKLINVLKKVKAGERNIETEFDRFKESLAEEYIYPKFGGKEEFLNKLDKMQK